MATTRRLRRAVLCSVAGAALALSACKGGESKAPAAGAGSDAPKAAQNSTSAAASTPVTRTTPAEPSPPGGPPRLPAATRALPAAHTVAVVGLEGLDWAFRTLNTARKHALGQLPPPVRAQVPELIADEGKLVELLSFPPETPSGWQTAGINPGTGVTVVFDDRVSAVAPLPLVYLGVRDRGVLMNWMVGVDRRRGGAGHAQATGELHGRCEIFELADERGCIGPRRGYQVFMPLPSGLTPEVVTALQSAFSAHIDDAGPVLADDAHFLAAFSGYPGRFMTYGWLNTRKLAQATVGSDALPATLAFYVDRFPGVAVLAGKDLNIARVLADDAGRQALNQVFGTPHRARELARRLPGKGGAFARLAVAPNTLFAGLDNLLPPSEAGAKGTVQHFSTAVPALLGVSLDALSKALSGQVTLLSALPTMGPGGQPQPDLDAQILALGLVDGAAADALLDQILTANATAGRLTHDQLKLASGEPARRFTLPNFPPVYLVRSEQTWLLGLSPKALEAALKQTGLESATVPTLEGEGFLAVGVDLPELIARMSGALAPGGAAPDLKGLLGDGAYAQFEIGLDPHGLALRNGQGLAVFVGITAAVAVPAFVKYVRRSKTSEARVNVARLASAVRSHLAAEQPTPLADAPLTPADWTCDPDGYAATPERFAHPTFKTLQFEPQGTQRYRYAVRTLPGDKVEVRAEGDLDCDGTLSVFRMEIHSGGASPLEAENELE